MTWSFTAGSRCLGLPVATVSVSLEYAAHRFCRALIDVFRKRAQGADPGTRGQIHRIINDPVLFYPTPSLAFLRTSTHLPSLIAIPLRSTVKYDLEMPAHRTRCQGNYPDSEGPRGYNSRALS